MEIGKLPLHSKARFSGFTFVNRFINLFRTRVSLFAIAMCLLAVVGATVFLSRYFNGNGVRVSATNTQSLNAVTQEKPLLYQKTKKLFFAEPFTKENPAPARVPARRLAADSELHL